MGLCFALNLERVGYSVMGVDLDALYIDSLNNKTYKTDEPDVEKYLTESENFKATVNIKEALDSELIFIIVPTPSSKSGVYDQSYIDKAISSILKEGPTETRKYIVIQSTTTPSYCEILHKKVESFNYEVVYNPEFIAQGSIIRDQQNPDVILVGCVSDIAAEKVRKVYSGMCGTDFYYHKMSLIEAEIAKIALNCFVTTKIAFANMIGDLAIKMNCNVDHILEAIGSDSRVGSKYLKYGFGYGGPCFPRDNRAFGVVCEWNNVYPHIPYATDKSNQSHLINQVAHFTRHHHRSEPVVLTNLAYKKGCSIIIESQQLEFAVRLAEFGYDVTLIDNPITLGNIQRIYGDMFTYREI